LKSLNPISYTFIGQSIVYTLKLIGL